MKFRFTGMLALAALTSCSTNQYVAYQDPQVAKEHLNRSVANVLSTSDFSAKVTELSQSIFNSYLYGQTLLEKYDQELDKNPAGAIESEAYSELLALRTIVEKSEDEIIDMYTHLVMVSADSGSSEAQKERANEALEKIGQFMDGIRTDGREIPANLRTLVLSNLVDKQTQVYDLLKATYDGLGNLKSDSEEKRALWKNMVKIRATRRAFNSDLSQYEVDPATLQSAVEEAGKDKDFRTFKREVKDVSKEIQGLIKEVRGGRSTSANIIYPSTGAAGNITGRGFPANTWSITYDDGPGGKTTPQVLANLKSLGYKATFFVLAKQVEALPGVTKTLVDAGMDMASHSYTHAQITKLSAQGRNKEIAQAKAVIERHTGKTVKLFRLPYGAGVGVTAIRQDIANSNMIHVFWNVDTLDWQDKNPNSIFQRSLKQMSAYSGGVILFHDIHAQSVVASKLLMDHMKKAGMNVCTVQGVVDQQNKNLPSCQ